MQRGETDETDNTEQHDRHSNNRSKQANTRRLKKYLQNLLLKQEKYRLLLFN
ncbi:MAG: hypothetical protein QM763_02355 [Agriterribacter sp.]